ncbi:MAG: HTH-type transcriptional regulator ChbR [Bacteroidota bacterium]|jgi:AraC-like DNA-binding protein
MNETGKITQYDFKPGVPLGIEVVELKQLRESLSHMLRVPHRVNFYDIIWIQGGTPVFVVDFNRIEIKNSTIIFINKSHVQYYEKFNDCEGYIMPFTETFLCRSAIETNFLNNSLLFNNPVKAPFIELEAEDQFISDLFHAIIQELNGEPDDTKYYLLQSLLFAFLLKCERKYLKTGLEEIHDRAEWNTAIQFRNLIDQHFSQDRSVAFYASQLNISEKSLLRSTNSVFGKSPKEVIHERLLIEAKRLLLHSNSNTKEIAFTLGFDEPTNFVKYFKKYTQKTPLEFRDTFFNP